MKNKLKFLSWLFKSILVICSMLIKDCICSWNLFLFPMFELFIVNLGKMIGNLKGFFRIDFFKMLTTKFFIGYFSKYTIIKSNFLCPWNSQKANEGMQLLPSTTKHTNMIEFKKLTCFKCLNRKRTHKNI